MRAARMYSEITARPVTVRQLEWLRDLADRFGDERVADAIEAEARAEPTKLGTLLPRARDRLAREDLDVRSTATFVDDATLLAIVRREAVEPVGLWYYDGRSLRADEYDELLRWATERRDGHVLEATHG